MSTLGFTFAVLAAPLGAAGLVIGLLIGVTIALALLASWITIARRHGWGSRSTLPRRWDWDAFDAQFETHVERTTRRRRREREEGV
jgi:hypothetical protein